MIKISGVTMRFGKVRAVDNVTLDLAAGDSLALWGANGAGKTTLIRCLLGLLRFDGSITVAGRDVRSEGKAARTAIGYVPQELAFYDDLGASEAIVYFGRLKGLGGVDARSALASVGLADHGRKRIRELSGGMKQRLALAVALLGDPPVLVLDEVTASLDAVGRREFVGLLERLSGDGRTLLFASHRVEEIGSLAKRVAKLERGAVTEVCGTREFLAEICRGSILHIMMPPEVRATAMKSLQEGGFSPSMNGVGVLVPVAPEQKAAPFRVLAEARIRVDDFEILQTEAHS